MKFFIRNITSMVEWDADGVSEVTGWMEGKQMDQYDLYRKEENGGAGSQYVSWLDFHTEYKPNIENSQ